MRPVDVVDPVRLAVVLGHDDRAQQLLGDLLLEASSATASPDRVELVVDGVGSGRNKRKNEVSACSRVPVSCCSGCSAGETN